jgi:hypothetical protein
MAHYAKVNPLTKKVDEVIVAEQEHIDTLPNRELWIKTNTGVVGSTYDADKDLVIPPKPYPSWVYKESDNTWEAPTAMPSGKTGDTHIWDESKKAWVER